MLKAINTLEINNISLKGVVKTVVIHRDKFRKYWVQVFNSDVSTHKCKRVTKAYIEKWLGITLSIKHGQLLYKHNIDRVEILKDSNYYSNTNLFYFLVILLSVFIILETTYNLYIMGYSLLSTLNLILWIFNLILTVYYYHIEK